MLALVQHDLTGDSCHCGKTSIVHECIRRAKLHSFVIAANVHLAVLQNLMRPILVA